MVMTPEEEIQNWLDRPMSYSQFSTWEYSDAKKNGKEEWYKKYIKNIQPPSSPELKFGKIFADSIEAGKPLAPVTILSKVEHKFEIMIAGNIKLVGYADTVNKETLKEIGEFKTGAAAWTQEKVDEHRQITLYALFNFITNKVKAEKCKFFLEWVPTKKVEQTNGDFSGDDYRIEFVQPIKVHRFNTKRTTHDLVDCIKYIVRTRREMEAYARSKIVLA
jgi:hypothetical protein